MMNLLWPLMTLIFGCVNTSLGARILLLPMDHRNHVNMFLIAGSALHDAGHKVWIYTSVKHKKAIDASKIHPILLNESKNANLYNKVQKGTEEALHGNVNMPNIFLNMIGAVVDFCKETLRNKDIMKQLHDAKFDLALIDGVPFSRCFYLLPYALSIPYVTMTAMPTPWNAGVSGLPSVEPMPVFSYTNEMTFFQRFFNTLATVFASLVFPPSFVMDEHMAVHYVPNKPPVTISELYSKSLMWLVNSEPYCFDYPRATAPNYHFIGGISAHPPKPLPEDLEEFMRNSQHGIIVMTFGSLPALNHMESSMLTKFLNVFAKLNQRVIMRQENPTVKKVPPNVKIQAWLPQNDLLAHPKTRMFITHGGNSGQLEALYHGIPMIVMPVAGDQFYNAKRTEFKAYGKSLNLQTFTEFELFNAVQEIMMNTTYRDNIRKCSAIIRQFPSPQENIVFWINHVLKFGGDHLRSPAIDMPIWKFFMLDVIILLQIILIILCVLSYFCCRLIWKCAKRVRPFPTEKRKTE